MTNENHSPRPWPWPEPPPGHPHALYAGCTCSPLSNNEGHPLGSCGTGVFYIAANCRYHAERIAAPWPKLPAASDAGKGEK